MKRFFVLGAALLFSMAYCGSGVADNPASSAPGSTMVVVLQVPVEDILRKISSNSKDEIFNAALTRAKEKQDQTKGDFITIFGQEFQQLAPEAKLAAIFATVENKGLIENNSTNEEVLKFLREQVAAILDITKHILQGRIDAYGIKESSITAGETIGRIRVELKGVDNPAEIRKLLQTTGKLEFWETWAISELFLKLTEANTVLAGMPGLTDSLEEHQDSNEDSVKHARENPLFYVLVPPINAEGTGYLHSPQDATMGFARPEDRQMVNKYLAHEQVRALLPENLKLLWGAKVNSGGFYPLYAIKPRPGEDNPPLDGSVVRVAYQDIEYANGIERVVVSMTMTEEGAKVWRMITRQNSPQPGSEFGRCIAIVMDSIVYTAPEVNAEIADGRCIISGNFTVAEAKSLASIIKTGKLAVPVMIIEEETR